MRIAQLGNFQAPWTSEIHFKRALELNGHEVSEYQENDPAAWERLGREWSDHAFVLWTRTWDFPDWSMPVLAKIKGSIPIVGYHLDRWWGLARESEIRTQQFFKWCDIICTADGGHDQQWADAGINHWWYPPGVLGEEAAIDTDAQWIDGEPPEIVFVGSHKGYHPEWPYRQELVAWLRRNYGSRVAFFPDNRTREYEWRGQIVRSQQVRGVWLNALYQHTKVVVGDSCLAGEPDRYVSDRVPETVGRGGLLVHPYVRGMGGLGGTFLGYRVGDFPDLERAIETGLADDGLNRATSRAYVLDHDTYERRLARLVAELEAGGLI